MLKNIYHCLVQAIFVKSLSTLEQMKIQRVSEAEDLGALWSFAVGQRRKKEAMVIELVSMKRESGLLICMQVNKLIQKIRSKVHSLEMVFT